ncbi:DNA methyltransferase [Azospirillum melinis]|uniref:DNA methyltransferase n=1 Tax=Azospirillum melinis TaxID=328839 RepID=UPI00375765C2
MSQMPDAYRRFLEKKVRMAAAMGFEIDDADINPILKGHQRAIVRWAVRGGRRAIFARFGLGKSVMQLEALRLILTHAGGRGLIVAPLGVRQEFIRDAAMLGIRIRFIRTIDEADADGLYLTNYETVRDGKLDPNQFTAVSLDEASVLRSFGSKTYQTFLTLFDQVRYRFVATATPSPNRYKELIHYAGFLGIMDTGQALTRWFQRNSEKAGDLTLFPHKEAEFWAWLHSWAIFLQRPSDLGFSDEGYDLPPLVVRWHEVQTNLADAGAERDGQGILFRGGAVGLKDEARERRDTLPTRVAKLKDLLAARPAEHVVIWHDLEAERHAIAAAVPGVVSVWGTQDLDQREQAIIDFSEGRIARLSTKPVIAGSGCNFQRHCAWAVFLGVSHKFNDFIQAVHRLYRFLQLRAVEIDIIHTEAEREIVRDLQAKWARHNELADQMSEIIKAHGLDSLSMVETLQRSIGVERIEVAGRDWTVVNNDTVTETARMPTDSVDLLVTSIPFANHYEYTDKYDDFGHTDDNRHFWAQMDFLTPELLRTLKPGRLACVHVKDRIVFGAVSGKGVPTVSPFHAEAIFHYMSHGFDFMGMVTVITDVVRENNQTYRLGYSEMLKDGTKMGVGSPEYVLLLHKPQTNRSKGYADLPVTKERTDYSLARWQVDAHAFWRSSGNRLLTPDELAAMKPGDLATAFTAESLKAVYDFEAHIRIGEALEVRGALPSTFMALAPGSWCNEVWHDINRMRTLNGEQSRKGLEMHICPLQFDIVDRLIGRFSMPGELVFDPFSGLHTVANRAVRMGRKGRGHELNATYFLDGVAHLQAAERELSTLSLFDILDRRQPAQAAE